ncbi:MAG: helix-turn-helix transcriptional regulator [Anaerolineales bacterium]|nr:helix-turn-helix transcriptional regulator [Anaerolineales bacterium]
MLSPREKQVVDLLLSGKSNKQIALSLGVSERTVEFHLKNIYFKMQVASRVELILKLGRQTGGIPDTLGESTVVFEDEKNDNDSHAAQMRAAESWRNLISLIRKEAVMTIKISFEDMENYLRNHIIVFSLLALSFTGLMLRFILFELGLYFWGSYLLLEILLVFGSIRFGELLKHNKPFHPLLIILIAASTPIVAWGFDQVYLLVILPYMGSASISIPAIHATAEWLTSAEGLPCLSTSLNITSDTPWLITIAEMLIVFFLSRTFGKHSGGKLVTA